MENNNLENILYLFTEFQRKEGSTRETQNHYT